MTYYNSNFQNLIDKLKLEDFEFKFDSKNNFGIGYNEKDNVYCIVNADGIFERSIKEFFFLKKNENGSFDSVNYDGYCHVYYDYGFRKKSKIVEEKNEIYVTISHFNASGDELSRKYINIDAFKNIFIDVEGFRDSSLFNDYRYHLFKDGKPNKLRFEKGKLKSEIYVDQKGRYNRDDGPAVIIYGKNGELRAEFWCKDDNYHKEDGPAKIFYDSKGNVADKFYYYRGQKITDEFQLSLIQVKESLNINLKTMRG